ncbi:uncharacterized protein CIMG_03679 [Coccidioides immitis RS]|uniref:Uncharacterized protein n=2 Tax=Coccidioides immitis TaxID=5501 RepID=J3KBX0_COCIM|nr:uncharacterized protein CIMG_03679 [Coccidioides immitis RS]EAS32655.3 hypothetical protein CIMG_03679 [Coccidioides immitis RS]KMP07904.1 secalin [Coccidioides immitis RMSCC 2394]
MEKNNLPMMPASNGDLSDPVTDSSLYLTPSKRKHNPTSAQETEPAGSAGDPTLPKGEPADDSLAISLRDILEVVSEYDSELKLLQYPLPSKSHSEPDNKRTKLSEPEGRATIESKINKKEYKSLQEFTDDVETVSGLVASDNVQSPGQPGNLEILSVNERSKKANSFKRHLNTLLLRTRRLQSQIVKPEPGQDQDDSSQAYPLRVLPPREDRAILTVTVGNPPRTYFSSFQTKTDSSRSMSTTTDGEPSPRIDESTLPSDIRVSKVIPYNATHFQKEKGVTRTFGEVFQSPSHLPQLIRPQKSKPSTSDNVVRWLQPVDILAASSRTFSGQKLYNNKPLRPGHWLDYGRGISRAKFTSSFSSGGDSGVAGSDTEESLFRSVYSSFAPNYDSGGAVMRKDIQYLAYWDKRGRDQFNRLFPDWDLHDVEPVRQLFEKTALEPEPLNDADLQQAIETFDPDINMDGPAKDKTTDAESSNEDVEQILDEISNLLRTLHSYRHLRNLYPPPGQLASIDSNAFGQLSDVPSEEEKATFEALKQSLSSMVALLPPYAVAKLDADQLAELNINTTIRQDAIDYAGTMEEDEWTIRQKHAPRVPQAVSRSPAPSTHPPRASTYQTPQHPNIAPHQRYQPAPPRTRNASANYQSPQGYATRQQSQAIQYQQTHPSQGYATTPQPSQRYVQQPYQQNSPAPQYTRAGMLQQFQRPSQNTPNAYTSQRGLSPSQTPQPQYPRPVPQANYQPRPSVASPHRPTSYVQTPQRQPYMNPQSIGTQPRYFQQQGQSATHYPNFPSNQASPIPSTYSNSAAAMAYSRSAAEQAALIERNRTPLMEAQRRATPLTQPPSHNNQGNIPSNASRQQLTPKPQIP